MRIILSTKQWDDLERYCRLNDTHAYIYIYIYIYMKMQLCTETHKTYGLYFRIQFVTSLLYILNPFRLSDTFFVSLNYASLVPITSLASSSHNVVLLLIGTLATNLSEIKYNDSQEINWIWKCRLQNDCHILFCSRRVHPSKPSDAYIRQ